MNTPINVISGAVGEGLSNSTAEFLKASPDSLIKCETPTEIFFSQATWNMKLASNIDK